MTGFLLLVEGIRLQVDTIVEVVPRGVGVVAFGDVKVVDHDNLGLFHYFLT